MSLDHISLFANTALVLKSPRDLPSPTRLLRSSLKRRAIAPKLRYRSSLSRSIGGSFRGQIGAIRPQGSGARAVRFGTSRIRSPRSTLELTFSMAIFNTCEAFFRRTLRWSRCHRSRADSRRSCTRVTKRLSSTISASTISFRLPTTAITSSRNGYNLRFRPQNASWLLLNAIEGPLPPSPKNFAMENRPTNV